MTENKRFLQSRLRQCFFVNLCCSNFWNSGPSPTSQTLANFTPTKFLFFSFEVVKTKSDNLFSPSHWWLLVNFSYNQMIKIRVICRGPLLVECRRTEQMVVIDGRGEALKRPVPGLASHVASINWLLQNSQDCNSTSVFCTQRLYIDSRYRITLSFRCFKFPSQDIESFMWI